MNNSVLVSTPACRSCSLYFCLVQAPDNSVLSNYLSLLISAMSLVHYSQMAIERVRRWYHNYRGILNEQMYFHSGNCDLD